MIVRHLDDVLGTQDEIKTPNWTSRRLLLSRDKMGFSVHDTMLHEGTVTKMCYRNHLEAVYCIEGQGEIENLEDGQIYAIRPGTIYALDQHDSHVLRALSPLRMVCVFNPPLTGEEVHDETGAYPLLETEPTTNPAAESSGTPQ